MADALFGIALTERIADLMNAICIENHNHIPTDQKDTIWRVMHAMRDQAEWQEVFDALEIIQHHSPGSFTVSDCRILAEAHAALTKCQMLGTSFVGKPHVRGSGHKNLAWQTVCRIREIINRYNGVYIHNAPPAASAATPRPSAPAAAAPSFLDLFE